MTVVLMRLMLTLHQYWCLQQQQQKHTHQAGQQHKERSTDMRLITAAIRCLLRRALLTDDHVH